MQAASLNHTFRLIWSDALQTFVAVAESVKGRGKKSRSGRALRALTAIALAGLALTSGAGAADLPTVGNVVGGSGSISQSGKSMTIHQTSARMATDWKSFSVGAGNTVNFVQPSASAVSLNRVTGSDVSSIQGAIKANGQVFLVNPNGVLFTPTAQVNVGSLVVSTLNLSNSDFMDGNYQFDNTAGASGLDGSIVNQGSITANGGAGSAGTIALIAAKISNTGQMTANQGSVLLGAGSQVTLDLGGPVKLQITQGAIDALIANGGAITANGGLVYLTAKSAGHLVRTVINNTGVIEAHTLSSGETGTVMLMGGMTSDKIEVGGTLDASAPNGGHGGFIETSAAHVSVAEGTVVTTKATIGKTGTWLIDPNDFTIAASGGDMNAATVASHLSNTNFEIATTALGTTGGNGDIFVNEALAWSSPHTLTLTAERHITINRDITATEGGLTLHADGQISATAAVNVGTFTLTKGTWSQIGVLSTFSATDFRISGGTFIRALGGDGNDISSGYQLADVYGLQGVNSAGMQGNSYALANNIDASGTSSWNAGAGFKAIGNSSSQFSGNFNGQNKTITDLSINQPSSDLVGLFGQTSAEAFISNVAIVDGNINGGNYVGGLVGNNSGTVSNVSVSGHVSGSNVVGGLIGQNTGTLSGNLSFSGDSVTGGSIVGGLIGLASSSSLASTPGAVISVGTGIVSGDTVVGGLVGAMQRSTISGVTITNTAQGTGDYIGGLVGVAGAVEISNSHHIGAVSSSGGSYVGGLVGVWFSMLGSPYAVMTQSSASGNVSGVHYVGGLVGLMSLGNIFDSYSTASVNGVSAVGGLLGHGLTGDIKNSYANGPVSGSDNTGGLVGLNGPASDSSVAGAIAAQLNDLGSTTTTLSFWDTQTSGQSLSAGGTGKSTTEMKDSRTFAGWDLATNSDLNGQYASFAGSGAIWQMGASALPTPDPEPAALPVPVSAPAPNPTKEAAKKTTQHLADQTARTQRLAPAYVQNTSLALVDGGIKMPLAAFILDSTPTIKPSPLEL